MSPEQQALVRESWRQFQPTLRSVGGHFYDRLFELDPRLRQLFAGVDLQALETKLMQMFGDIVQALDEPSALVAQVAALGRRHVQYGVKDGDYESVGAALLWTLEQGLGEAFTPEVREAWAEAYLMVATVMRRAAARTSAPHPTG
jgi:hemoglobin-like flavoprotein